MSVVLDSVQVVVRRGDSKVRKERGETSERETSEMGEGGWARERCARERDGRERDDGLWRG